MNIFKFKQFYIAPISSMDLKDLCRSRYTPFLEIKLFRIDAHSHIWQVGTCDLPCSFNEG